MKDYRWSDLSVGLSARFEVTLTQAMMDGFSAISGDTNPLHLDADFARRSGFPGPVVFGLLSSSFYSQLVGVHLPGRHALLHGIEVDFKSPAFVGDALTVSGEVIDLSEAYRRIEIRARITNQNGTQVSRAKIRVGLHEA